MATGLVGWTSGFLLLAAQALDPEPRSNTAFSMAERPVAPVLSLDLVAPTLADCDVPQKRTQIVRQFEESDLDFAEFPRRVSEHSEKLMQWKEQQLTASGRWSEKQRTEFGKSILGNAIFLAEAEKGFAAIKPLFAALTTLIDNPPKGEIATCKTFVNLQTIFLNSMAKAQPHIDAQWRIIDEAYAAEAKRIGVDLK